MLEHQTKSHKYLIINTLIPNKISILLLYNQLIQRKPDIIHQKLLTNTHHVKENFIWAFCAMFCNIPPNPMAGLQDVPWLVSSPDTHA
jgi:hypothetical protein